MKKSIFHAKLITLNRRLAKPSREIQEELAKCEAGLEGERRLIYFLSEITGPVRILHDLRLPFPNGFTYFQIDTLLITPSLLLIFEAKHIHGKLQFNRHTKQLLRGIHHFPDPITQVLRHKTGLERWLDQPMPIKCAVVLTHPAAQLSLIPEDSPDREFLLFPTDIPQKIAEWHDTSPATLPLNDIHRLVAILLKHNCPYDPDIMERFQIQPELIHRGIQCGDCMKWTVKRVKKSWVCQRCKTKLKNPHVAALKDYVRLFGTAATNQQIRHFTGIESETVVKKLLLKWSVRHEGKTKGRVYTLPESWKWE